MRLAVIRDLARITAIRRDNARRTVALKTHRRLHEEPTPQACGCTRSCRSLRNGWGGPIVRRTDEWHVSQGGGTGPNNRRALSEISGLSVRFVLGWSEILGLSVRFVLG